jgi:hypothetical protein
MAYLSSYGATGYGFPSYGYPTTFASAPYGAAPAQQFAVQQDHASQHEGSQVGDSHAAQSVSGFAGQPQFLPADAGFYGFPQGGFAQGGFPQATFIGGGQPQFAQQTIIPGGAQYGATIFPGSTALVPLMAPQIRRPGYNERLVAWRNRQKAFNRYKRETKRAIKVSNSQHMYQSGGYAPTVFGAAPVFGGAPAYGQTIISQPYGGQYGGQYGAPYGATYLAGSYPMGGFLPAGAVYAGEAQNAEGQQYGDFTSYSSGAAAEQAQEEPEIRGTQV